MSEPESAPEQPLLAHLMELRTCVVRAMFGFIIVLLPLLFFAGKLYHFLATPMMKLLPAGSSMIATEVAAPFLTPFKLAAVVAFALALPWILYQIWLFVAPGLYRNERRLIMPMLASSTLLFYAGVAFAYYLVLPTVFKFFVTSAPEGVAVMTDVSKYLDFVLKLFLAFGFVFEMPVAIVLMVLTGFVTPAQLAAKRDYVLVGVFIAAAVLTPPDVLSQIMLAVPAYLLYELGILVARWVAPVPEPTESTDV
ncbi:twin-arginine translocase subunit TatC [uncultured Nevskia sp.]|uniref:twin-arginine translocase subunit TatC n=1 Tax=uncultured Nevskia sp. TaxID=228950 RepID=UPI0025D04592|nr:twin-arginine translocase subunit TatC [uncultured Nevskia sp.]